VSSVMASKMLESEMEDKMSMSICRDGGRDGHSLMSGARKP